MTRTVYPANLTLLSVNPAIMAPFYSLKTISVIRPASKLINMETKQTALVNNATKRVLAVKEKDLITAHPVQIRRCFSIKAVVSVYQDA